MRIGIVTQPLEMNYGGILQNWALQQALRGLGHDPITIDAFERYSTPHYLFNCLRAIMKKLQGKRVNLPKRYHGSLRNELLGQFVEQHIAKTRVMWDYKRSVVNQYRLDALVVGSDQVWRARYNGGHLEDMFLKFAQGLPLKRRVAYAASFGVDEWGYSPEQTRACAGLAQQLDAVSVREQSGVDLCRNHLGVEACCVLDPTLLLKANDFEALIGDETVEPGRYLAVYCLDITPEKKEFFEQVAKRRGLEVRYFSAGWSAEVTVQRWLAILRHASMVVTDSFHGTVFSILFGKEFYTVGNLHRGNTRFLSLLQPLGLVGRFINVDSLEEQTESEIDWTDVFSRLDVKRRASVDFLSRNLNV